MATTNTGPHHCGDPMAAVAVCSPLEVTSSSFTASGRALAHKPRPAKIDIAAASYCRASGTNYGHVYGHSVPANRPAQCQNVAGGPQVPNVVSPHSTHVPSPQFPGKKQSMLKSFFANKMSRCTSNSVGPSPNTPTSPLALFSYTQTGQGLQIQQGHQHPLTPDSCSPTDKANGYYSDYAGRLQEYGGRHSHEMADCLESSAYGRSIAPPTPLSPPEFVGHPCNLPSSATCDGHSANGHGTSVRPFTNVSRIPPPSKQSTKQSLGLHNLVIPQYEQLQKRREDLKRNDTSHLPHPQPIPTVGPCGRPSVHPNQNQDAGCGGEKLTVAAKYLSNHTLNPEFARRYQIGDELGSGGFGFVVSARQISESREVAVKFIHKDKVPVHGWVRDPLLDCIPMEIYVIRNFPHPGVIGFIDMFDDQKFFYLVMELHGTPWTSSNPVLQGNKVDPIKKSSSAPSTTSPASRNGGKGGLVGAADCRVDFAFRGKPSPQDPYERQPGHPSRISKNAPVAPLPPRPAMVRRASCDLFECIEHHSKFSENKAKLIFRQVVECVHFLNGKGICHRDIKDENIVIDKDLNVKLIDFGSAVLVTPSGRLFDRFYGTINYASPEILRGEKYRAEAAEIWSLGILLYTLLYGEVPFNDPQQAMYASYLRPKQQSSPECLHILNWTLEKSADRRATIEDVFNHPWLAMTEEEMEQARL